MSFTTIRFRTAEFVANDLSIEFWMFEVTNQIDSDVSNDFWLDELREEWRLQATSGFGFGPSPSLDKFVDSDDRQKKLLSYFQKALNSLAEMGNVISPDELKQSGVGGEQTVYEQGLPTQKVIEVGEKFILLLNGVL